MFRTAVVRPARCSVPLHNATLSVSRNLIGLRRLNGFSSAWASRDAVSVPQSIQSSRQLFHSSSTFRFALNGGRLEADVDVDVSQSGASEKTAQEPEVAAKTSSATATEPDSHDSSVDAKSADPESTPAGEKPLPPWKLKHLKRKETDRLRKKNREERITKAKADTMARKAKEQVFRAERAKSKAARRAAREERLNGEVEEKVVLSEVHPATPETPETVPEAASEAAPKSALDSTSESALETAADEPSKTAQEDALPADESPIPEAKLPVKKGRYADSKSKAPTKAPRVFKKPRTSGDPMLQSLEHARKGTKAIQPVMTITTKRIKINNIDSSNAVAPRVVHGLDRVLFNPGVHYLQDPASGVYNFDPYIEKIMPIKEFEFGGTMKYIKPSEDKSLQEMASKNDLKYLSSSSNMTGLLEQLHFLVSGWRPLKLTRLSYEFDLKSRKHTAIARSPTVVNLRWRNGTYAIDKARDPELDNPTILSLFGNLLEKALILPPNEFEKYRKGSTEEPSKTTPDGFLYSNYGKLLWRSQLDAYDPRLPGSGVFDLKTRAVVSLRFFTENYEEGLGYEIFHNTGNWMSYEREFHDMARATMLKYLLQVRLGRMDGIFVAYHNIQRLFGFQYLNLGEMDYVQHGQTTPELGDQEFRASLHILNEALEHISTKFPEQSIRVSFETREATVPFMYIFAEPVSEEKLEEIELVMSKREKDWQNSVLSDNQPTNQSTETDDADGSWQKMKDLVDLEIQRDGLAGDNDTTHLNKQLADVLIESRSAGELLVKLQEALVEIRAADSQMENAEEVLQAVTELRAATIELSTQLERLDDMIELQPAQISSVARDLVKEVGPQLREQTAVLGEIESWADKASEEIESANEEEMDLQEVYSALLDTKTLAKSEVPEKEQEQTDEAATEVVEEQVEEAEECESAEVKPAAELKAAPKVDGEDVDINDGEIGDIPIMSPRSKPKKRVGKGRDGKPLGPLYAMVLTVRNRVDGVYTVRPERVTPDTDWKIEYSFSEICDPVTAWRNYDMLKERRRKALDKQGRDDWFLSTIATRVEQSREIRKQKDDQSEGQEKVVYQPHYGEEPDSDVADGIESVESVEGIESVEPVEPVEEIESASSTETSESVTPKTE